MEYIGKRPMLLCGILSVICAAAAFYFRTLFIIICILIPLILALMIIFKVKAQLLVSALLTVILLFSCISTVGDINRFNESDVLNKKADICVCDITYESTEYSSAKVEVTDGEIEKGTKLSVTYKEKLYVGQTVEADITAKAVDSKYKEYYYAEEIYLKGSIKNITPIDGKDDFVLKISQKIRDYIKETLFSKISYPSAATLCAIIFGDNSYFTNEFYSNVKGAGVSHVMVVSGMHLSVLVLFFTKLTELIAYNRYFKAFVILLISICLTAICGFTMSMLRAGFTYALIALSLIIDRQYNPENVLGAAVTFILIDSPNAVLSGAFQLSVAATFGILAIASPIMNYIRERELIEKLWLREFVNSLIVTLSALIMTLPITIKLFGYVSNVALITNFLISYAVTMALSLGIIALITNLILPVIADAVFILLDLITNYINTVINIFGSKSFSVTVLPEFFWIIAVLIIIAVFWILLACKKRRYMLKLKEIDEKILNESGKGRRWQQFLKRL